MNYKKIKITHNGKDYYAQFTPTTVKALDRTDFTFDRYASHPVTYVPKFFAASLRACHPTIREALAEEILRGVKGKHALLEKLIGMYVDVMEEITDDPNDVAPEDQSWGEVDE